MKRQGKKYHIISNGTIRFGGKKENGKDFYTNKNKVILNIKRENGKVALENQDKFKDKFKNKNNMDSLKNKFIQNGKKFISIKRSIIKPCLQFGKNRFIQNGKKFISIKHGIIKPCLQCGKNRFSCKTICFEINTYGKGIYKEKKRFYDNLYDYELL